MKKCRSDGSIFFIFLVLTVMAAFANAAESNVSDSEFMSFNLAHPEKDAADALAHGHMHCFSVNGYGRYFPGVEAAADRTLCMHIERNISGTSDVRTPEHDEVQRAAIPYATAYNKYIIAHARELK